MGKSDLNGQGPEIEDEGLETEEETSGENSPQMEVLLQYIKDLTFENPDPASFFRQDNPRLETNVEIDVQPRQLGEDVFEVVLTTKINVSQEKKTVYILDLHYSGIFRVKGNPEELVRLFVMVECPRYLFPFTRSIVAQVTQNSGFPTFDLKPVNFLQLLQQRIQEAGQTESESPST